MSGGSERNVPFRYQLSAPPALGLLTTEAPRVSFAAAARAAGTIVGAPATGAEVGADANDSV